MVGLLGIVALALANLIITPLLLKAIGWSGAYVKLAQFVGFVALGAVAVFLGVLPLWAGIALALTPAVTSVMAILYFYWLGQRALAGKMGQEQQWVAELVSADDEKFMESMNQISQMQMKEIFVIADSKEELRQTVIEEAED